MVNSLRHSFMECQFQFRHSRWNCSIEKLDTMGHNQLPFRHILWRGFPHTAFLHSLVSASFASSLAERCSQALIPCPCSSTSLDQQQHWHWYGCENSLHFGIGLGRRFLDRGEYAWDLKSLVNLHNYEAGRRILISNNYKHCTCHGTSGSCASKTCIKKIPKLRVIGNELRSRYFKAIKVTLNRNAKRMIMRKVMRKVRNLAKKEIPNSAKRIPKYKNSRGQLKSVLRRLIYGSSATTRNILQQKLYHNQMSLNRAGGFTVIQPRNEDLVYYENVPHQFFCEPGREVTRKGVKTTFSTWRLGTATRECNSTSSGPDNCFNLCCGRGYRHEWVNEQTPCECRFVWCCDVNCKSCLQWRRREICL